MSHNEFIGLFNKGQWLTYKLFTQEFYSMFKVTDTTKTQEISHPFKLSRNNLTLKMFSTNFVEIIWQSLRIFHKNLFNLLLFVYCGLTCFLAANRCNPRCSSLKPLQRKFLFCYLGCCSSLRRHLWHFCENGIDFEFEQKM